MTVVPECPYCNMDHPADQPCPEVRGYDADDGDFEHARTERRVPDRVGAIDTIDYEAGAQRVHCDDGTYLWLTSFVTMVAGGKIGDRVRLTYHDWGSGALWFGNKEPV